LNKMERRCPNDSYEKHLDTSVDGNKTRLKLESSYFNILITAISQVVETYGFCKLLLENRNEYYKSHG